MPPTLPINSQAAAAAIFFVDPQSIYDQKFRTSEKSAKATPPPQNTPLDWQRDDIEIKFNELASDWRAQRAVASSLSHSSAFIPAYQFIIGMGPKVLPYILRELAKKDEDWYWALRAISQENPIPPDQRGKRSIMRQLWLQWGVAKKYVW